MVVISGLTTAVGSSTIRARRGSNQPWKHSPDHERRERKDLHFSTNALLHKLVYFSGGNPGIYYHVFLEYIIVTIINFYEFHKTEIGFEIMVIFFNSQRVKVMHTNSNTLLSVLQRNQRLLVAVNEVPLTFLPIKNKNILFKLVDFLWGPHFNIIDLFPKVFQRLNVSLLNSSNQNQLWFVCERMETMVSTIWPRLSSWDKNKLVKMFRSYQGFNL